MNQIGKVGVVSPPEEPQLPPALSLAAPPHAQHVGLKAAAETAQDGVLLRHREEDGGRGGTLPHELLPFDPRQVSLQPRGEREEKTVRGEDSLVYNSAPFGGEARNEVY